LFIFNLLSSLNLSGRQASASSVSVWRRSRL
jgi:hypothetical protein